jgi:hypothetical protein
MTFLIIALQYAHGTLRVVRMHIQLLNLFALYLREALVISLQLSIIICGGVLGERQTHIHIGE